MNLLDVNVWLALVIDVHDGHNTARDWLTRQSRDSSVAFCQSTTQSLLRLLTLRAVFAPYQLEPATNAQAWAQYLELRRDTRVTYFHESDATHALWQQFSSRSSPSPKLWADAYVAALAVTHGMKLVTFDHGFTQFKGLDLVILKS